MHIIICKDKKMLVPAEIWTVARSEQGSAVLVRPVGSELAVPIMIGQAEAQSIMIGLSNQYIARPLTHDLMLCQHFGDQAGLDVRRLHEAGGLHALVHTFPQLQVVEGCARRENIVHA